jgi:disulfide bond formation protein DsbB
MNLPGYRTLSALGFAACATALAFALYLQHGRGYVPCAMCIGQRVAMMACGLVFLIAALHGPRRGGRAFYAALGILAAATGGFIAGRQVWLQSLPPGEAPACGPTPGYLWNMLPKGDAVRAIVELVFKGDGDCAKIDAQWLGLTLPAWTLLAFVGLALWALLTPALVRRFGPDRANLL